MTVDPVLDQLAASLASAKSIEQLTRPLLEMLGEVTQMESTYLTSIDLEAALQNVRFAHNTGKMVIPEGLTVPWEDTLCRRALSEGCMSTNDVPTRWADSDAARQLGIQTYVSSPVLSDDGAVLGTLCAASTERRDIGPRAQTILRLFSNLVASFLERELLVAHLKAANDRLTSFAMTDALTGLPNRRALFDELQRMLARAVRERACVLVAVIDLDGFKAINDRYGHLQGDLFLQQIAQRLSAKLRATDMLARMGGDEFVIIGPGPVLDGPADGSLIGNGLGKHASQRLQQRTGEVTVGLFELGPLALQYAGASVGAVALDPEGLDAEAAVRLADAQMYEVKRVRKLARPDEARR